MVSPSLYASEQGIRIDSEQDALDALYAHSLGLIFQPADLSPEFFDLSNGLAGAVFQKYVNYNAHMVILLPTEHKLGARIAELAREHARHPNIRFFTSKAEAETWLRGHDVCGV